MIYGCQNQILKLLSVNNNLSGLVVQQKEENSVQVLLVGLGKVGMTYDLNAPANQILTHARAIDSWSKSTKTPVNIVGVDVNEKTKEPFYNLFKSGEWFPSISSIETKKHFDLAIIATPISSIAQDTFNVCTSLEVNKFVIEKPAASNLTELKTLMTLPKSETNFIVGFPRPALPSSSYLKTLIESFGKSENWEVDIYYAGTILNILSHFLNLVEFLIEPFTLDSYSYSTDGFLQARFISSSGRLLIRTHQYGNINDEANKIYIEGPISIFYSRSGRSIEITPKSRKLEQELVESDYNQEISSMIGNFANKYMSWVSLNEANLFTHLNSVSLIETIRLAEAVNV